MVLFPKDKLQTAHKLLQDLGFEIQHQRILRLSVMDNGLEYQCMLGFETEGEDKYEANFSFMKRKVEGNAKDAVHATRLQVISFDDVPPALRETINKAEAALETL